jgi:hypothetical protein
MYGAISIPIGLLTYGWTAEKVFPSAIPIVATGFVGFGVTFTFVSFMKSQTAVRVSYLILLLDSDPGIHDHCVHQICCQCNRSQ